MRFNYNKFSNQITVVDGIKFRSKKESTYYQKLLMVKQGGELAFFLRQVPLHLPGNIKYVVDFVEFWKDGRVRFVDVKGFATPTWERNRKMVEALYPIKIETA